MHNIKINNSPNLKANIEAYIYGYQPAGEADAFERINFDAPKPSIEQLISMYGELESLGVSRGDVSQQAIDHYNKQFKVGAARCKKVFGSFYLRGIIMLFGGFTPMDCWVDAYFQARRFAGSQSLEGFFYSEQEILSAADEAFYSRLDDISNKKAELALAGIIKNNG